MPLAWGLSFVAGVRPLRAVAVSLLHWFSGASCRVAFCLGLRLDLFIGRVGCAGDFCSGYECSSCPSLLRFVGARGLEGPAGVGGGRSGVFSSRALARVVVPSLSSFLFSLPPARWGRLGWLGVAAGDRGGLRLQVGRVGFDLFRCSPGSQCRRG